MILLVWVHGVLGLRNWLRMRAWYPAWSTPLGMAAALVPALAFAGFAVGGRQVRLTHTFSSPMTSSDVASAYAMMDWALWGYGALLAGLLAFRLIRDWSGRFQPRVAVTYVDGPTITCHHGPTLLEMSHAYGIPHASICGGRARCSTCRVRIVAGGENLPEPDEIERRLLRRIGASDNVRLACQLRPGSDLTVTPLLPASASPRTMSPASTSTTGAWSKR